MGLSNKSRKVGNGTSGEFERQLATPSKSRTKKWAQSLVASSASQEIADYEIGARILSVIAHPKDRKKRNDLMRAFAGLSGRAHRGISMIDSRYIEKPTESFVVTTNKGLNVLIQRVVVGRTHAQHLVTKTSLKDIADAHCAGELGELLGSKPFSERSMDRHRGESQRVLHLCLALFLQVNGWTVNDLAAWRNSPRCERRWWSVTTPEERRNAITLTIGEIAKGNVDEITQLLKTAQQVRHCFPRFQRSLLIDISRPSRLWRHWFREHTHAQ